MTVPHLHEPHLIGLIVKRERRLKPAIVQEFMSSYGGLEKLWNSTPNLPPALRDLLTGLNDRNRRERAAADLTRWQAQGTRIVLLGEPEYPELLRSIFDPPLLLFVQGARLSELHEAPGVAIIGSRRCSTEGVEFASRIAREVAGAGNCVVSGLAAGIDAAAHRGALESQSVRLPTIAVLGGGFQNLYPTMNRGLARQILDTGGTLLSQFEPEEKPLKHHFLDRNRVIAGLSWGVVVVEAAARSGALATARHALEEGRELCVTPGAPWDFRSAGCNQLLRSGAHLITTASDVFEAIPNLRPPPVASVKDSEEDGLGEREREILSAVRAEGRVHLDRLRTLVGRGEGVSAILLTLEFQGLIRRDPGGYLVSQNR